MHIQEVLKPENSLASNYFKDYHYADAFQGTFKKEFSVSTVDVIKSFFQATPFWVIILMKIRNFLVRWVGIKAPVVKNAKEVLNHFHGKIGDSLGGVFHVVGVTQKEILTAEKDKHLDFCLSFIVEERDSNYHITLTTVVKFNSLLGKIYFFPVKPIHKIIVKILLKKMIKQLSA